jgi:regulatory protein
MARKNKVFAGPDDHDGEPKKEYKKAKNYALRLIKFRLRSEKEIRDKLKNKGYGPEVIEEVLAFLKKTQFVDDALFAKLWVQSRIKRSMGLGRLAYELKGKGIDKGVIQEAISGVREGYNEEEVVREIIQRKLAKMRHLSADKIKARLYGFLLRRGYTRVMVVELIRALIKTDDGQEDVL